MTRPPRLLTALRRSDQNEKSFFFLASLEIWSEQWASQCNASFKTPGSVQWSKSTQETETNRMQCSHHMLHNSVFGLIVCCQVLIFLFKKMCILNQVEAADMKLLNLMILNSKAWGGRFNFYIAQLLDWAHYSPNSSFSFNNFRQDGQRIWKIFPVVVAEWFFVFVWRFQTLFS